jgi:hypothetical protein
LFLFLEQTWDLTNRRDFPETRGPIAKKSTARWDDIPGVRVRWRLDEDAEVIDANRRFEARAL